MEIVELGGSIGREALPSDETRSRLFADLAQGRLRWLHRLKNGEDSMRAVTEAALEKLAELGDEANEETLYARRIAALSFSAYSHVELYKGNAVEENLWEQVDSAAGQEHSELSKLTESVSAGYGEPLPEPWQSIAHDLTLLDEQHLTTLPASEA